MRVGPAVNVWRLENVCVRWFAATHTPVDAMSVRKTGVTAATVLPIELPVHFWKERMDRIVDAHRSAAPVVTVNASAPGRPVVGWPCEPGSPCGPTAPGT